MMGCSTPEHSAGKVILCSPEQTLQGAQGARLGLYTRDAAATPGIALGTAMGTAQTSPSAPVRDKAAPAEALLSGKGHRVFKPWQTHIYTPAAAPPQGS